MLRPSASPRLLAGFALAAAAGAGIGLGAVGLGSSPAPAALPALHAVTAAGTTAAPATTPAPAPVAALLTVDQAKAVALHASPGTVVEVKQDDEASDPAEPTDPTEARDPAEATDAPEATGPSFEVTVLHPDGTTTEVVVDAATGHVVSTKVEDNRSGD